jgi:hypothetical protein
VTTIGCKLCLIAVSNARVSGCDVFMMGDPAGQGEHGMDEPFSEQRRRREGLACRHSRHSWKAVPHNLITPAQKIEFCMII